MLGKKLASLLEKPIVRGVALVETNSSRFVQDLSSLGGFHIQLCRPSHRNSLSHPIDVYSMCSGLFLVSLDRLTR